MSKLDFLRAATRYHETLPQTEAPRRRQSYKVVEICEYGWQVAMKNAVIRCLTEETLYTIMKNSEEVCE